MSRFYYCCGRRMDMSVFIGVANHAWLDHKCATCKYIVRENPFATSTDEIDAVILEGLPVYYDGQVKIVEKEDGRN